MQPGSSKVVSPSAASPAMAKDMAIRWSDRRRWILAPCKRTAAVDDHAIFRRRSHPRAMAFRFSVTDVDAVGFFYLQFLQRP